MKNPGLTPRLLAATLFLGLGLTEARAQDNMRSPAAKPAKPSEEILKRPDKNGDGKLDDDERAAAQKYAMEKGLGPDGAETEELLRRFDKNANGRIADGERPAMQEFLKARMAQEPLAVPREADEKAGLERVIRAAVEADATQLRRFDRDQNGKLDDDEWRVAREEIMRALAVDVVGPANPENEMQRFTGIAADVERRRTMRLASGGVALTPSVAEEKRRLEAVAAEVARRRKLRESAAGAVETMGARQKEGRTLTSVEEDERLNAVAREVRQRRAVREAAKAEAAANK